MTLDVCRVLMLTCYLAVSSWILPQPRYSQGLIVVYGSQRLVQANALVRGYTLADIPDECGLSEISPAGLGEIVWVSTDQVSWLECRDIDSGGRSDVDWLLDRHEIAEVADWTGQRLGFPVQADGKVHGAMGYLWRGPCPPPAWAVPEPYDPPRLYTTNSASDYHGLWQGQPRNERGYPEQVPVVSCHEQRRQ